MPTVAPEAVVAQLKTRYATKRFDPARTIPADVWTKLEECLVLAPSSFGLQPWRFIVVTDKGVRAKLQGASWNQAQVGECSHHVVFAARATLTAADVERFMARTIEVRKVSAESVEAYKGLILGFVKNPPPGFDAHQWASKQAYIALGQFMASAAMMGVDTCPMEGLNPAQYDEILGLGATGYKTVMACAAGYRAADDKYAMAAKVRYAVEDVIVRV